MYCVHTAMANRTWSLEMNTEDRVVVVVACCLNHSPSNNNLLTKLYSNTQNNSRHKLSLSNTQRSIIMYQTMNLPSFITASLDSIANAYSSNAKSGQHFQEQHYDNVEHQWNQKPFAVDKPQRRQMGAITSESLQEVVQSKRSDIASSYSELLDPDFLVLTPVSFPSRNKVLISLNEASDAKLANFEVEYLSGTWLSKVYKGEYASFLDSVDDMIDFVEEKYGRQVLAHCDILVYRPVTAHTGSKSNHHVVVLFAKISDE